MKDACVLIDLARVGLLDPWFHLGILTYTTDLVVRQVQSDQQWPVVSGYVETGALRVVTLNGDQVTRMRSKLGHLPIGVEDQTVLFLASEMKATLFTVDRRLRLEGLGQNLEVRNLIWIYDELVAHGLVTDGDFSPRNECEKRFEASASGKDAAE